MFEYKVLNDEGYVMGWYSCKMHIWNNQKRKEEQKEREHYGEPAHASLLLAHQVCVEDPTKSLSSPTPFTRFLLITPQDANSEKNTSSAQEKREAEILQTVKPHVPKLGEGKERKKKKEELVSSSIS